MKKIKTFSDIMKLSEDLAEKEYNYYDNITIVVTLQNNTFEKLNNEFYKKSNNKSGVQETDIDEMDVTMNGIKFKFLKENED